MFDESFPSEYTMLWPTRVVLKCTISKPTARVDLRFKCLRIWQKSPWSSSITSLTQSSLTSILCQLVYFFKSTTCHGAGTLKLRGACAIRGSSPGKFWKYMFSKPVPERRSGAFRHHDISTCIPYLSLAIFRLMSIVVKVSIENQAGRPTIKSKERKLMFSRLPMILITFWGP